MTLFGIFPIQSSLSIPVGGGKAPTDGLTTNEAGVVEEDDKDNNNIMVMRCILGCSPPQTLFPIPKVPWLRVRWLQFLHFDDGGVTENTRLCARHFTQDSFKNFRQHEMGFVKLLLLSDTAVPCVYTVGASPGAKVSDWLTRSNHKHSYNVLLRGCEMFFFWCFCAAPVRQPLTRDVGCQCSPTPVKKSTAVQATRSTPKPKRRSKGKLILYWLTGCVNGVCECVFISRWGVKPECTLTHGVTVDLMGTQAYKSDRMSFISFFF